LQTSSSINSTAITYTHNGRQYVTVASGARYVRVRGRAKVFCHLMFDILALTIDHLMRLVT